MAPASMALLVFLSALSLLPRWLIAFSALLPALDGSACVLRGGALQLTDDGNMLFGVRRLLRYGLLLSHRDRRPRWSRLRGHDLQGTPRCKQHGFSSGNTTGDRDPSNHTSSPSNKQQPRRHVGEDLNNSVSNVSEPAGYFNSPTTHPLLAFHVTTDHNRPLGQEFGLLNETKQAKSDVGERDESGHLATRPPFAGATRSAAGDWLNGECCSRLPSSVSSMPPTTSMALLVCLSALSLLPHHRLIAFSALLPALDGSACVLRGGALQLTNDGRQQPHGSWATPSSTRLSELLG
ncbi:hypothetical protein HU200_035304 [Digitaria exilis]|uniref:Uncharacterized protein n=1 Tax=Digitaria exilis TaxID=1010633 RepID=A0A835ELJ4_9POAL|nr:hypothetical protein HU200_035304 [Digitaria exilis]